MRLGVVLVCLVACTSSHSSPVPDASADADPARAVCHFGEYEDCTCSGGGTRRHACGADGFWQSCPCTAPTPDGAVPPPECDVSLSFYIDADGDGFGDVLDAPTLACAAPPGMVADHTDCADKDPRAKPGQTEYQTTPVVGPTTTLPFDFDCNAGVDFEWSALGNCNGAQCGVSQGWTGSIPNCGETGTFLAGCGPMGGGGCSQAVENRVQACR